MNGPNYSKFRDVITNSKYHKLRIFQGKKKEKWITKLDKITRTPTTHQEHVEISRM